MWGSAVQAATMMDRRRTDDGRLLQVQVGQRVLHIVRLQVVTLRMGKFGMLALVWHAPIGGGGWMLSKVLRIASVAGRSSRPIRCIALPPPERTRYGALSRGQVPCVIAPKRPAA